MTARSLTSADAAAPIGRRDFLGWGSSAAAFFAAHPISAEPTATRTGDTRMMPHRILALELLTAVPLAAMRDFYHRRLGLRVVEDLPQRLTFAAGETSLTFLPAAGADDQPFYHFAFNIPENKIEAAWQWQKERTPLLPIPPRLRDGKYPDDVVNYAHWNAHSVFFFDPAGNVVEYIARHDLENGAAGEFGAADILYASEIAFVTDDVPRLAEQVKEIASVSQYRGGDENFMALGDERGLLLIMKRGRVISFDAPEKKAVNVFRTAAKVSGPRAGRHALGGHPFDLTVE
jgi:catechol 2,3-dioxygenase-like lactoylglutathione lyase family enzyme